jgi:hypothetical protein
MAAREMPKSRKSRNLKMKIASPSPNPSIIKIIQNSQTDFQLPNMYGSLAPACYKSIL